MSRDDWKYDEDMMEGGEEEAVPPKERPCPKCLHVIPTEAPYCPWCGKPHEEPRKPPR